MEQTLNYKRGFTEKKNGHSFKLASGCTQLENPLKKDTKTYNKKYQTTVKKTKTYNKRNETTVKDRSIRK